MTCTNGFQKTRKTLLRYIVRQAKAELVSLALHSRGELGEQYKL